MIDKRTQQRMAMIGKQMPKKLLDKLVKNVPTEEYQLAQEIINDSKMPPNIRKQFERSIESGAVKQYEQTVDSKTQRELDRFTERRVAEEIKSGRMAKPNPNDPFMRKMRAAMKKK